jgi:ketosteroid isomerase-like protein
MKSTNNFCVVHGDLALLRADWELVGDDGRIVAAGSSAEVVRKQSDGRWLYVIDHAAALPRTKSELNMAWGACRLRPVTS